MGKMKALYMDIVELSKWNLDIDEIADQLYCDPKFVRQVMEEEGIYPKSKTVTNSDYNSDYFDDVSF